MYVSVTVRGVWWTAVRGTYVMALAMGTYVSVTA